MLCSKIKSVGASEITEGACIRAHIFLDIYFLQSIVMNDYHNAIAISREYAMKKKLIVYLVACFLSLELGYICFPSMILVTHFLSLATHLRVVTQGLKTTAI